MRKLFLSFEHRPDNDSGTRPYRGRILPIKLQVHSDGRQRGIRTHVFNQLQNSIVSEWAVTCRYLICSPDWVRTSDLLITFNGLYHHPFWMLGANEILLLGCSISSLYTFLVLLHLSQAWLGITPLTERPPNSPNFSICFPTESC